MLSEKEIWEQEREASIRLKARMWYNNGAQSTIRTPLEQTQPVAEPDWKQIATVLARAGDEVLSYNGESSRVTLRKAIEVFKTAIIEQSEQREQETT